MASHLIGVLGLKRSGKDTFAARLVSHHGFTRLAFADVMREALLALDPVVEVEASDGACGDYDCCGPSYTYIEHERLTSLVARVGWWHAQEEADVRRLLQRFGTEAGREIHGPDVWVNLTAAQAAAIPGPVVITDVRFPNEVDFIAKRGGSTVRVTRPGIEVDPNGHASETSVNDAPVDYTVLNDSTIDHLNTLADAIAATVLA